MVQPNIGAFIAWGLITAMFIPTGWWPNEHLAALIGPMITYMLPLLIGYSGGHLIGGGCEVDLITTAVGPNILAKVAVSIAQIIEHRSSQGMEKSLNVIACENKVRASTFLKGKVEELLSPDALDFSRKNVGFADSAVDRIVPLKKSSSITDAHVEEFFEWVVDKTQLKEGFEVQDCKLTDKLLAFVERKLFTLNTGHATIAYMGAARG